MKQDSDIAICAAALKGAQERYEELNTEYCALGRRRTDALNVLNDAQKALDAALAALRKGAPADSDWRRERGIAV